MSTGVMKIVSKHGTALFPSSEADFVRARQSFERGMYEQVDSWNFFAGVKTYVKGETSEWFDVSTEDRRHLALYRRDKVLSITWEAK